MRVSAFTIVDPFPTGTGEGRRRFGEVLDLADACEQAGLAALWVAEHHFHTGGLCPSPPVLLAAASQRTKRLRLGVMVSVLPFHDPVALAEEYALVDQLSNGRLNLGVGSGYISVEFEGFGIDPASKRERFDRSLETLLAAFAGRPVRSNGANAREVLLNVAPAQRPHPPLWVAAQRREALPFIARRGVNLALVPYATVQSPMELGEEIQEFRRHLPSGSGAEVAVALHAYAGRHPDLARQALQRFLDSRLATHSTFYQQKVLRDPHAASAETIERSGFALFGTPREVGRQLAAYSALGVDEVLAIVDFGGLAAQEVRASVEGLGQASST